MFLQKMFQKKKCQEISKAKVFMNKFNLILNSISVPTLLISSSSFEEDRDDEDYNASSSSKSSYFSCQAQYIHQNSTLHTALRGGQMSKLKIGFHSPQTSLHIMVNAWNKKKLILNLFGVWNVSQTKAGFHTLIRNCSIS